MTFRVQYADKALEDIRRLMTQLAPYDPLAARRARNAIKKGVEILKEFPFTCRKAAPDTPFMRELVIPYGGSGFVALFEIMDSGSIIILAVRHQHADDYS